MNTFTSILCLALLATANGLPTNIDEIASSCDNYIDEIGVTCPSDRPNESVTFADPDNCGEYWECWNGCATHMECTGDLVRDIDGIFNAPNPLHFFRLGLDIENQYT